MDYLVEIEGVDLGYGFNQRYFDTIADAVTFIHTVGHGVLCGLCSLGGMIIYRFSE